MKETSLVKGKITSKITLRAHTVTQKPKHSTPEHSKTMFLQEMNVFLMKQKHVWQSNIVVVRKGETDLYS